MKLALFGLRAAAERYQRPARLGELEISVTPQGTPDLNTARQYADLGVHRLAIQPPSMVGSLMDELIETIADTLIGRV